MRLDKQRIAMLYTAVSAVYQLDYLFTVLLLCYSLKNEEKKSYATYIYTGDQIFDHLTRLIDLMRLALQVAPANNDINNLLF